MVAMTALLDAYSVGLGKTTDLCLAQSVYAHDVETGVPVFGKVTAQTLPFGDYRFIHFLNWKAFCLVGLDARDIVAHTKIVEPSISASVLAANLRHGVKLAWGVFLAIYKGVSHGLVISG